VTDPVLQTQSFRLATRAAVTILGLISPLTIW
jgi:hypothetical protein